MMNDISTSCRQRNSLEKTKDWIKDAATIMGQSVKSGAGRGQPHDEEQPLLFDQDNNVPVSPLLRSLAQGAQGADT